MENPVAGHEQHRGKLAIPYLRTNSQGTFCCSIRFRCIEDHVHEGHGKYATVAGDQPWLYNTAALGAQSVIGIAEGEIDAIFATACGVPAVGVPGVESWGESWGRLFEGYDRVFVFVDGDEPGRRFARKLGHEINNVRAIEFGEGHDVSSFVLANGAQAFKERIG